MYRADGPDARLRHVLPVHGREQLAGRVVVLGRSMLVPTDRRLMILAPVPVADVPLSGAGIRAPAAVPAR